MEKYYVAAINAVNTIGSRRILKLIEVFGNAKAAWQAEKGELEKVGLPANSLESFLNFRLLHPNAPENLAEFCAVKKINICSIFDEDYPPILKESSGAPPIFYYRGTLETFAKRIAIVGTRRNTNYGEKVAFEIARDLAAAGLTIVSGAAKGIDSIAHYGALKSGRTVAVLGCGITFKQGKFTQNLLDEIAESGGLVMTEFDPTIVPSNLTFPPRNRIIAGLSKGVLVVEAGEKSGALITTNFAADYSRDVFAVPGSIYSEKSQGCNDLIRDGATLITNAQDILDFYNFAAEKKIPEKIPTVQQIELDEMQKKVFNLIPLAEEITADEILMQTDEIDPNEISEILLQLEIKKLIQENGGIYTRLV